MRTDTPHVLPGGGDVTYVSTFPQDVFTLTVDPAALRASVAPHRRLQTLAAEAAREMSTLTAPDWKGAEGDLYRARVTSFTEAPKAMASAMETAVKQVETFAVTAEQARQRMTSLAAAARSTHETLRQESLKQLTLTGTSQPGPATRPPGPYVQCTPLPSQALFAQQVAAAQRIKQELAAAARAAAAAISAIPAPPPVPISSGALTSEQLDAAQEDVVVRRDSFDMSWGLAYRSFFGRQGLKVQMETLDDGQIKVTVLRKDEVGIAGDGSKATAEGGLETTQGVTYQVQKSEVPSLLAMVAASYIATKRLPPPGKGGGYVNSVGVNGTFEKENKNAKGNEKEQEKENTEPDRGSRSLEAKNALTTQVNTDGSVEATWSGEMAAEEAAKVSRVEGDRAPSHSPRPKSRHIAGGNMTMTDPAGAAAAAVSVKVVARPDGTNSITTTVRREQGIDPATPGWKARKTRVVEDVTTRVVSASEAKAILQEARDPRRRGEAMDRIRRIAMESAGAAEGPEVQRHRYEYDVEKIKVAGEVETKGAVTGVEGEEEVGRETLVSKDGRPVKQP